MKEKIDSIVIPAKQKKSSWKSRIHALGPGILLASGAVGGSHLIASTQAGALYGWQLAIIIILANLFKYPFFRFSTSYTLITGKNLLEGYAEKSKIYLWIFMIITIFSGTVSAGAVILISTAIIKIVLPIASINILAVVISIIILILLLFGHYRMLDKVTKWIMVSLTLATVFAVSIAIGNGMQMGPEFIEPSPWNMASLGFIIALMGWMPAPLELTAINSMWVTAKQKLKPTTYKDALFDFNLGYLISAILAMIFLSLGALVQYGNGEVVQMTGGAYINQLVGMYTKTIGDWSRILVIFIAFACIFGTAITVVDGYARVNAEAIRLIFNQKQRSLQSVTIWMIWTVLSGLILIVCFNGLMSKMLKFAMIATFLTAPIIAWLNYRLVTTQNKQVISPIMKTFSILGLIYLIGFTILFILDFIDILA